MIKVHRSAFICSALVLLAACGDGDNGAPGASGLTARILASSEPVGVHCAQGGSRIDSGLDVNANGVLDAGEVDNSQYVCNGASPALGMLVRMVDEPAGVHCAHGGKQIDVGSDSNANGFLDDSEVSSTAYVCHGADGAAGGNGSNGLNSLVSITAEPVGANCALGGKKIKAGLDSNANGVLEPIEAMTTSYVCAEPTGAPLPVVHVTDATQQAEPNTAYLADHGEQVTITLPAHAELGDVIRVAGVGAGGWKIAQNAGQTIQTAYLAQPSAAIANAWSARAPTANWQALASSADGVRLAAVAFGGNIFRSVDSGVTWTSAGTATQNKFWRAIASSADGERLVAAEGGGHVYTSANAGVDWIQRNGADIGREWQAVASSADGMRLVAVAFNDKIYQSADGGVTWAAACDCTQLWRSVASSADGMRLVAVVEGGSIFTSADGGVSWTARATDVARPWFSVTSSADGKRLVAAEFGGRIYTSNDLGVTWTPRDANRDWTSVASSANGKRLVAATFGGLLYVSSDFGVNWTAREAGRSWYPVATSADGLRLVAAVPGGLIYTSNLDAAPEVASTTIGTPGSISADQFAAIELQYVGGDNYIVLSSSGVFDVR